MVLKNHGTLVRRYEDKFITIYKQAVVDSDEDIRKLMERVEEKYPSERISVEYIPAYNEERTIASVMVKAMRHVGKVIVCDDGASDMASGMADNLLNLYKQEILCFSQKACSVSSICLNR